MIFESHYIWFVLFKNKNKNKRLYWPYTNIWNTILNTCHIHFVEFIYLVYISFFEFIMTEYAADDDCCASCCETWSRSWFYIHDIIFFQIHRDKSMHLQEAFIKKWQMNLPHFIVVSNDLWRILKEFRMWLNLCQILKRRYCINIYIRKLTENGFVKLWCRIYVCGSD